MAVVVSDTSPIRALSVLQNELRFFISPALRAEVLRLAGETDET
jgi:hypothetical protein